LLTKNFFLLQFHEEQQAKVAMKRSADQQENQNYTNEGKGKEKIGHREKKKRRDEKEQ
jgi:hypothetical protein